MIYHTDAYTIGENPSRIGGGFTIVNEDNELVERKEFRRYWTCNEGELRGIHYAAELADVGDVIVTDSQVAISWVRKGSSKARPDLDRVCADVKELMQLKGLELVWVKREENLAGVWNEHHKT